MAGQGNGDSAAASADVATALAAGGGRRRGSPAIVARWAISYYLLTISNEEFVVVIGVVTY